MQLDTQGRLSIGKELFLRAQIKVGEKVNVYFDPNERRLLVTNEETDLYFVENIRFDTKYRCCIPVVIRNTFPNGNYLPALRDGNIYILIL